MKLALSAMILALTGAVLAQDTPVEPAQQPRQKSPTQGKKAKKKALKVGDVVPASITLSDIDGKTHTLKDYRGKVVVINFWAYRCPAIKASQSKLSAIHADYKRKDVVVLGINSDRNEIGTEPPVVAKGGGGPKTFPGVRKFIADRDVSYPILVDHKNVVADLLNARTTPHMFVIDKKGVLRYSGALDQRSRSGEGEPYVRNAIDAVLAGNEVKVSSTKPYG